MLKNSFGKRLTGGVISAAMLISSAASVLPGIAMTASAGQQLGQTDFDDGIGLPWHTCVSNPAKLDFELKDKAYYVTIVNPGGKERGGDSRWDCQFRHRKLTIAQGHTYHVHAEVTATNDGQIYSKIGDLAGSWDNELWHNAYGATSEASYPAAEQWSMGGTPLDVKKGETLIIDAEFEAKADLPTAEWAFHFGGAGDHQATDCFPVDTVLTFDNMSLEDTTSTENDWLTRFPKVELPENAFHVNQVGYFTNLEKKATLHSDSAISATKFYVVNKKTGDKTEFTTGSASSLDKESGYYAAEADFSSVKEPGTYYLSLDGSKADSYEFQIGDDILVNPDEGHSIVLDALNYFYQNRAGVPIDEKYITSKGNNKSKSALAHTQAGHKTDTAYLQSKWVKAYANDGTDVEKTDTITASHGWYDAGDHGKYVVNGGISIWTLQNMYEWTLADSTASDKDKFGDSSKSITIPEAGNKIPDILDETKIELQFFQEMMVPSSYKLKEYPPADSKDLGGKDTGEYTNMVFHKLHDSKWTGLAVHAWDYQESKDWKGIQRIVKPPSTAATLNAAACFAQGARLFKDSDSSYADELLADAKKTYEAAKANPQLYAPLDQAIGGGAYGDDHVEDDFYWAACELYVTTGDDEYKKDLESYSDYAYKLSTNLSGGENNGTFTSFNWGNTAGLGTLSLYLNGDAETKEKIAKSITSAADEFIAQEEKEGFGVPYKGSTFEDPINIGPGVVVEGYEWGSNSMVINNAIVLAYAYNATGDEKYLNGCAEACDYIFGRNALDFSYVTGYGTYHCINPHHRLWSNENDPEFPFAPSGVMSGGANAGMQDPYVAGMGYKRGNTPSQKCYVDSIEAWSVNEVTINWNSPFAWVMSFLEDEAPKADGKTDKKEDDKKEDDKKEDDKKEDDKKEDDKKSDVDWGNVDCSKGDSPAARVDVADAVLLARFVAEDSEATISAEGKANADVNASGEPDAQDTIKILKFIAKVVPYSSLGTTKDN